MDFSLTLGDWNRQKTHAQKIRREVFVVEQHVPEELEWDEMDGVSLHALAHDVSGMPIGTGRLLPDGHIGRMAVRQDARSLGVGSAILRALMEAAARRGDTAVLLHAQTSARRFYERFGFLAFGEEFMEAGIPHVMMQCGLERQTDK